MFVKEAIVFVFFLICPLNCLSERPLNKENSNSVSQKQLLTRVLQDLKLFSVRHFKGYLHYKTITSLNVSPEAQVNPLVLNAPFL